MDRLGIKARNDEQSDIPMQLPPIQEPPAARRTLRAVVCCMRNEAVFLPEWVAYHLSIGFDRIFLVTNGCQDGTDLIADRLAQTEPLIHIRNPVQPGEPPQAIGLPFALHHPVMADVEWLLHIDADEFLNVTAGAGRVDDLIAVAGNCDCIAVAWRYIASGGRAEWTGGSLIAEQTMTIDRVEDHLQFHKSLFRPEQFGRITCHMPKEPVKAKPVLHNTLGTKLPLRGIIRHEKDTFSGIEPQDFTWANADIHHYFVRSADVFMLKNIRGDGMAYLHGNHVLGSKLYSLAERDVIADTSIQRHLPAVQTRLAQYAADPVLKNLMADALDWLAKQRSQYFTPQNLAVWDRRGRRNTGKVGKRLLRQNKQANS